MAISKKKYAIYLSIAVAVIIGIIIISRSTKDSSVEGEDIVKSELVTEIQKPVELKYGLAVDSFKVESRLIKRNEFLSDILTGFGVNYSVIDKLARTTKEIFDVRKIRSGKRIAAFYSDSTLRYFVYEIDNTDFVRYRFVGGDSVVAEIGQKEISTKIMRAHGKIESSLWMALSNNNVNPVLANDLSEIYAWTIDFFALQQGDKFDILYEERYVDSISIGIGNVYASNYTHKGKSYEAFRYILPDSTVHYFNSEGESLQKAFLKAPLKFSRISSGFSYSRMHPVLKYRRAHLGVDYAAATGTPVRSIGDGTVIKRAYQKGGGGNYLKIKHNSVYTTTYMHLNGFAKGITVGTRVSQGDVIGYVGSTGIATGPHLDFRIQRNGKYMNPLKVEAPPVEPLPDSLSVDYRSYVDSIKIELFKNN